MSRGSVVGAAIMAAGAGRRFGGIKQLAPYRGRALLQDAVDGATASERLQRVVVVFGSNAAVIEERIDLGRAQPLRCPNWEEGLSASLRCGLEALQGSDVAVLMLGDQPGVRPPLIGTLLDALAPGDEAVRATFGGRPGHPVVIRSSLFEAFRSLRGDRGARELLVGEGRREIECGGPGSGIDIDTPADLARAHRDG